MSTVGAHYTPEDLLTMPDGNRFELVNGHLVERNMGSESSWVGGRIFRLVTNFNEDQSLGWVWPADNGYQCFPLFPNLVRRPDVSFIRFGRLPGERPAQGHERIAPDLAVEVISPNDLAHEIDQKIEEYLQAGVKRIWVVYPETRTVHIHRPDGSDTRLRENDELTGENILPGFRCRVGDFFPGPAPSTSP
jgi:Uma2 family endonuclease